MAERDDFSKKTVEILGKRANLRCSNPDCAKLTVAPSKSAVDRTTSIGVAAHITAAAAGGPRYDGSIDRAARISIKNGIWLCANCATLIDREPKSYTVELLHKWKDDMESSLRNEFEKGQKSSSSSRIDYISFVRPEDLKLIFNQQPRVEGELTFYSSSKTPLGYSANNDRTKPISVGEAIQHNRLQWDYILLLVNNSEHRAYNIAVHSSNQNLVFVDKLNKVNSLEPLDTVELRLRYTKTVESLGRVAAAMIDKTVPNELIGTEISISYLDEQRKVYTANLKIAQDVLDD